MLASGLPMLPPPPGSRRAGGCAEDGTALHLAAAASSLDVSRARRGRAAPAAFMRDRRRSATNALLYATAGGFALQVVSRGAFLAWGAKVNERIAAGQLWRLLTPALLHGNLLHLSVNCYSLHNVGPAVEALYGPRVMGAVYAAAAVMGSAASFALNPAPAVGASGAIFGLLGCLTAHYARHARRYGRVGEARARRLAETAALNLAFGLLARSVDNWAHLGGFACGALAGWGLD